MNISQRVTPNIHTSEEREKEPMRRLSGAHLERREADKPEAKERVIGVISENLL